MHRRVVPVLAALAAVMAVLLVVVRAGADDQPEAATTTTTERPTTTTTEDPDDEDEDDDEEDDDPAPVPSGSYQAAFPPVVALLGDSLLHAAEADVEELLEDDRFELYAIPGLRADDARRGFDTLAAQRPAAFGVVLGTNHAFDGATDEDLLAVRALAESVAAYGCVRWVDLATNTPDARFNEGARRINQELAAAAARHPSIRILPWGAELAAHPEWVALDGVHHTAEGSAALAERVVAALRTCPGAFLPS